MSCDTCEIQNINFSRKSSCGFVPSVVEMKVNDMQLIPDLTKHSIRGCGAEPENLTIPRSCSHKHLQQLPCTPCQWDIAALSVLGHF